MTWVSSIEIWECSHAGTCFFCWVSKVDNLDSHQKCLVNVWLMSGSSQNYGESWNQPLPGIIGIAFSKAPLGWLSEPTSNDSLPLDGEECRGSEFLDFKSQVC